MMPNAKSGHPATVRGVASLRRMLVPVLVAEDMGEILVSRIT
jgi:hypothetical protein